MSANDADATSSIDTNLFITVSGTPGAGLSTLGEGLAAALDCGHVSGGELFREIAEEHDWSLTRLLAEAQETDEIDRALDRRLQTIAEKWGATNKSFVLESRIAGWLAGHRADLRIWLDAPEEVRAERTRDREELDAERRVREVIDKERYEAYYGIDLDDRSIYDLVINTARWDPASTQAIVLAAIREYDPAVDEGAFTVSDLDV